MKKLFLILAIGTFTIGFAQENKNKEVETKTTKTTITDNTGKTVLTRKEVRTENQEVELENTGINKTNYNTVMSPSKVNTNVTYSSKDYKFSLTPNDMGYDLMRLGDDDIKTSYAKLRPTSQKGYYFMSDGKTTSFVYFNEVGNLVVETYDPETDAINTTVYSSMK